MGRAAYSGISGAADNKTERQRDMKGHGGFRMRNKIIAIILAAVFAFGTVGCGQSKNEYTADETKIINIVEKEIGYAVMVDTETGVMYLKTHDSSTCVMVNPDGTPKIYGEDNGR